MYQLEYQPDEIVEEGARWLVRHRHEIDSGVIPTLRTRFGATSLQAIEMVRIANTIRATTYGGARDAHR